MPMSRLAADSPVRSAPSTSTAPRSGWSKPATMRSAVVLPQPDGPSSATSSPGASARSKPSSARAAPKERCRPDSSRPTPRREPASWAGAAEAVAFMRNSGRCGRRRDGRRGRRREQHSPGEQQAEQRDGARPGRWSWPSGRSTPRTAGTGSRRWCTRRRPAPGSGSPESRPVRRFGSTTRQIVTGQDAPSAREASTSVRRSTARSPASSER